MHIDLSHLFLMCAVASTWMGLYTLHRRVSALEAPKKKSADEEITMTVDKDDR